MSAGHKGLFIATVSSRTSIFGYCEYPYCLSWVCLSVNTTVARSTVVWFHGNLGVSWCYALVVCKNRHFWPIHQLGVTRVCKRKNECFGQQISAIQSKVWRELGIQLFIRVCHCFELFEQSPDGAMQTDNNGACSNGAAETDGHGKDGPEIDGPYSRAWNCRTWNSRTWKCKTWNCKTLTVLYVVYPL